MRFKHVEFVRSAVMPGDLVRDDRPKVAFAGRSNVGKSSLINKMLKKKGLARTSGTPGRTRAVNYFLIDEKVWVVDLPGYGYARVSHAEREKWDRVIGAFFERYGPGMPTILLIDAKIDGSPLDVQAVEYFLDLGARLCVTPTKIDRVPRSKRSRKLRSFREFLQLPSDTPLIPVSSKTGEGLPELWRWLDREIGEAPPTPRRSRNGQGRKQGPGATRDRG